MDLELIRSDFPALSNYTWFQNGGVSITPRPVAEEHIRLMRELFERGPMHIIYPEEEYPRRIRTKDRLGEFFNVEGGDLALMRGVSEGFQTILRGLDWKEGDHVLMTAEEEAALFLPTLHLRDLFGVKVDKIPLVNDLQGQVDAVEELITDRTRLIAFSHVITDSGFRLPCKEICHLARERGILTFADMAHSAGLYPMDLYEEGCDFAGLLSYKWMYAPYASGALFVRKERLDDIRVTYAGGRAEAWADWVNDKFELKSSAERFEYGPWSWPLIVNRTDLINVVLTVTGSDGTELSLSWSVIMGLVGDFDGDDTVGFSDFLPFAGAFGSNSASPSWDPTFDLDGDDSVGFEDFLIFARFFGISL